ncbi:MAG: hypothetical protein JWO71_1147 [Candidatus Acidoferrum typicum]|nr:hypothetical protein [Candidatus Acidoferrum typicum]
MQVLNQMAERLNRLRRLGLLAKRIKYGWAKGKSFAYVSRNSLFGERAKDRMKRWKRLQRGGSTAKT